MAAILVLGVKVPFTSGGQEALVRGLVVALRARGHQVDTVELPFALPEKESILTEAARWRGLPLSQFAGVDVDLVICTKFPSYFASHPRKSVWLVHQHRPLYDLYGSDFSDISDDPRDETIRRLAVAADTRALSECGVVAAISQTVAARVTRYNGLSATVVCPPLPLGDRYKTGESKPYLLSVGRICGIKRVDLMVKALPMVHEFVKLKIVGEPDEPGIMDYLKNEIAKHHLTERVEFLGRVSDEDLIDLYAHALAVYYAPFQEDYGFVTLEAFASGKAVITARDSGGTLEFVRDGETGLVVEPTTDAIAAGCNALIADPDRCAALGASGRELVDSLGLKAGWDSVISVLLRPLSETSNVTQFARRATKATRPEGRL